MDGPDVTPYQPFSDFMTQQSPEVTGNALLDRVIAMLTNSNSAAMRPQGNQDFEDVNTLRERNRAFLTQIQKDAAIHNQLTSFLGLNPNSTAMKVFGMAAGDPNGVYARTMQSMGLGNPMLAASNMYAGLTGSTTGAFGMVGNVSANQVGQMMQAFNSTMYNTRKVDNGWIDSHITDQLSDLKDTAMRSQMLGMKRRDGSLDTDAIASMLGDKNKDIRDNILGYAKMSGTTISGGLKSDMRGFTSDEMSSAFVEAAELRMFNKNSLAGAAGDFATNAPGVMSAGRALFGDVGGKKIMEGISTLAGNSYDINNTQDAGKLEQLLRNVKSVAAVAGQNIDSLMNIIKTTEDVFRNHPALQYTNPVAITGLVQDAALKATKLNSILGRNDARTLGGVQDMETSIITDTGNAATSLAGKLVSAATYLGVNQKDIDAFNHSSMGNTDKIKLERALADQVYGGVLSLAGRNINDPTIQQLGMSTLAGSNNVLGKDGTAANLPMATFRYASGMSRHNPDAQIADLVNQMDNGTIKDEQGFIGQLSKTNPQALNALELTGQLNQFYFTTRGMTKDGKEKGKWLEDYKDQMTADRTSLDKQMGGMYQPVIQSTINSIMDGGASNLSELFKTQFQNISADSKSKFDRINDYNNDKEKTDDKAADFLDKTFTGQDIFNGISDKGKFIADLGAKMKDGSASDTSDFDDQQIAFMKATGLNNQSAFDSVTRNGIDATAVLPAINQLRYKPYHDAAIKNWSGEISKGAAGGNQIYKDFQDQYGGDLDKGNASISTFEQGEHDKYVGTGKGQMSEDAYQKMLDPFDNLAQGASVDLTSAGTTQGPSGDQGINALINLVKKLVKDLGSDGGLTKAVGELVTVLNT